MGNNTLTKNWWLSKPLEWDAWKVEFKKQARIYDLWDWINPENIDDEGNPIYPLLPKPEPPAKSAYNRQSGLPVNTNNDQHPARPGTSVERLPRVLDANIPVQYSTRENQQLNKFMATTVSKPYYEISSAADGTMRDTYIMLRANLENQDTAYIEVTCKYKKTVAPLSEPPESWEAWIVNWHTTIQKALALSIPCVRDPKAWFSDLVKALQPVIPQWINTVAPVLESGVTSGTFTYYMIAHMLRERLCMHRISENDDSELEDNKPQTWRTLHLPAQPNRRQSSFNKRKRANTGSQQGTRWRSPQRSRV
ncbi:uncharacterized protein F4812DRAFT_458346 [Daldinia caldariorum]|uniref:uncharacterized protein n=1 Tax=Daldinia caldariorum TaxID=326644 RepID=UPI002007CB9D|nr:uncharacterized protein F4812DRAFT_458346 [Daldinia caldariorum]KAI1468821.1 hypothetical protein F4812DRAFT_458346 [Daldinia caldariorum]